MSQGSWYSMGHGIYHSTRLKRLIIQNCNLATGSNFSALVGVDSSADVGTVKSGPERPPMTKEMEMRGDIRMEIHGAVGLKDVKSLELIDLQCNELEDRHENEIC